MNTIEIRDVTKKFGDLCAVNNISIDIEQGTIFGLIGPNGAGKSTTIKMIMDIIAPDNGTISIYDKNGKLGLSKDKIGFLPEERGLYQKMKVIDHMKFLLEIKGVTGKKKLDNINYWFNKFDIKEWLEKKVEELSKGMQQKIQFIATIAHDPEIVILDEPFSGLDPVNMEVIKDTILELKKDGKTILFSTHLMEHAEKLCDHICMINKGKVVLNDTLLNIKRKYGNNTIKINYQGNIEKIKNIENVKNIKNFGNYAELELCNSEINTNKLILNLISNIELHSFEFYAPSLHNIFLRLVNTDKDEIKDGNNNAKNNSNY